MDVTRVPPGRLAALARHAWGNPEDPAGDDPAMLARVTAGLDDRNSRAMAVCCESAARGRGFADDPRRIGPLSWGGAEGI